MGKLDRKGLGLALSEIDQDAGDIVGLRLEVDAGDDVGAVLLLGKPRRGRIGRGLRQRVDRRALRIALFVRQGIGVDRHEQGRSGAAGNAHTIRQRNEGVVVACQQDTVFAGFLDAFAQALGEVEHDVLLRFPACRLGSGVDAAMPGIEHDRRPGILGIGARIGLRRGGRRLSAWAIFSSWVILRR